MWLQDSDARTVCIVLEGEIALERDIVHRYENRWPVLPRVEEAGATRRPQTSDGILRRTGLISGEDGNEEDVSLDKRASTADVPCESMKRSVKMTETNTPRGLHFSDRKAQVVHHLVRSNKPGDLFGEEAVLGKTSRMYSARVVSAKAAVLVLNAQNGKRYFSAMKRVLRDKLEAEHCSDEKLVNKTKALDLKRRLKMEALGPAYIRRVKAEQEEEEKKKQMDPAVLKRLRRKKTEAIDAHARRQRGATEAFSKGLSARQQRPLSPPVGRPTRR